MLVIYQESLIVESVFQCEDQESRFFWSICTWLPDYVASDPNEEKENTTKFGIFMSNWTERRNLIEFLWEGLISIRSLFFQGSHTNSAKILFCW
jgi:hypothetical protein